MDRVGSWRQMHDQRTQARKAVVDRGKAWIQRVQSHIHVSCPYHPDWPTRARELGGYWRQRSYLWSFPATVSMLQVLNLLVYVHGYGVLTGVQQDEYDKLQKAYAETFNKETQR